MKKILALVLASALIIPFATETFAANPDNIPEYKSKFRDATGPEVDGLAIDYVSYSPADDGAPKPLVIYTHGMGQGKAPRAQIEENNISLWASDELQARFTNGGAYILVPRSQENHNEFWSNKYIKSLKAAIDDFIAQNRSGIDVTRIYIGGFSMGGKMAFKMITSYPDFFAAAFPMCPAYLPSDKQIDAIKNMPIWMLTSKYDILAGYHVSGEKIWKKLCERSAVAADCRLSLFGKVCYPDGKKCPSNHFVWFAASNDMFTYDEKDYPNMVTTDGLGNTVTLTSPDGLISWLCKYTSNYDGQTENYTGLAEVGGENELNFVATVLRAIFPMISDTVKSLFAR